MIQRIASSRSRSRCYTKSWNNNRLAPAHVVGGLDDRGDVLPARTSAQGRAADDGRSGSCDPAGSLRSANPTPSARANSGDCRDCHGDDGLAHGARRIDLSVHCGFLLLWLVCRSAPLTMRRARSACCQTSRARPRHRRALARPQDEPPARGGYGRI